MYGQQQANQARTNTNEYVYNMVRQEVNAGHDGIEKMSEYYDRAKLKLYAKLVTARKGDPGAEVSFDTESLKPHGYGTKRWGRPRLNWVRETMQLFWNRAVIPDHNLERQTTFNLEKEEHVYYVKQTAEKWAKPQEDTN